MAIGQRRWVWLVTLTAIALLAVSVALGVDALAEVQVGNPEDRGSTLPKPAAAPVLVSQARAEELGPTHVLYGVIRASERASLTFTLPGRIVARSASVGDWVAQGQPVARLDAAPFVHASAEGRASLADLTVQRDQLQRDVLRDQALGAKGALPAAQLEQGQARLLGISAALDGAASRLAEADRRSRETVLKAPFSGVVTEVFVQVGEFASPGAPVVSLMGQGVEVQFEASERAAFDAVPGAAIRVHVGRLDGPDVVGTIRNTSRASAAKSRLFPVLVDLPQDPRLAPGMDVVAKLSGPTTKVITVPLKAVVNVSGQRPTVFRVNEGTVRRSHVSLGQLVGESVVVTEGLNPGDTVVTAGHWRLLDGDPVEVREATQRADR